MKPVLQVVEAHAFAAGDAIGGDAALDFINTVTGRDDTPRDWLDGYARLVEWAAFVDLLPAATLRALSRESKRRPAEAAKALARAKMLRENLFALVTSVIDAKAPSRALLASLREHWLEGTRAHDLDLVDGRVAPRLRETNPDFDLVASIVAYRLVERVLPLPVERLRICEGPNCSWLFIDRSKAGRRRWCDMAVCGNAAKSRRFQARAERS